MKGVILGICPEAVLIDVSHEIRPQAIRQAAYVLSTATPYFPQGTVHLVVVDPGVGTGRRPIAVRTERAIYVSPDNGVLSQVLAQDPPRRAVHITEQRYHLPQASTTFHGRDIFAPVAAHLACGLELREMGPSIPFAELVTLPILQPTPQPGDSWRGEVLHIDHFGNVVANLRPSVDSARWSVDVGEASIQELSQTYADVESGELVAYVGSSGYLEIAVRDGSAAARLGVDVGDAVRMTGGR
jgi:S-adenosylmethionine hydrolase